MNGRYIVADDGSETAGAARIWAQRRAVQDDRPCVAVHVEHEDIQRDRERRNVPGALALSGRVPQALAGFVGPGDVLVLGTGKTGFVHGRVSGFTGVQIVALTACTVAVVPDIDLRFRSGVVVGVNRPETATGLAHAAGREASRRGDAVQVIHARERETSPNDPSAVHIAGEVLRTGWPQLAVRTRVVSRPVVDALLDAARAASLLVIGRGTEAPVPDESILLGRVVFGVLVNANAPVLVVTAQATVA